MARIERASNQKPLEMRWAGNKQGKGWKGLLGGGLVGAFFGGIPGAIAGAATGDAIEEYAVNKTSPNFKNLSDLIYFSRDKIDPSKKYMSGYY